MDAEQPVSKSIRGSTWSDEETRCLVNIWSEQKIQEELGNSNRNTHVYSTISRNMGESDFNRTTVECRQGIKTLKQNYLFLISFVRPILNLPRNVPMISDTACANITSSAAVQFGFLRTVTDVSILKAIF